MTDEPKIFGLTYRQILDLAAYYELREGRSASRIGKFDPPEEPIFELINRDIGLHIEIYASGKVVAPPNLKDGMFSINRFWSALRRARAGDEDPA